MEPSHHLLITIHNVQFEPMATKISTIGAVGNEPLLHRHDSICLGGVHAANFNSLSTLVNAAINADSVGDFELYRLRTDDPRVTNSFIKWLDSINFYPEGTLQLRNNDDDEGTVTMLVRLPRRIQDLMRRPEEYNEEDSALYLMVLRGNYLIPAVRLGKLGN